MRHISRNAKKIRSITLLRITGSKRRINLFWSLRDKHNMGSYGLGFTTGFLKWNKRGPKRQRRSWERRMKCQTAATKRSNKSTANWFLKKKMFWITLQISTWKIYWFRILSHQKTPKIWDGWLKLFKSWFLKRQLSLIETYKI